MAKKLPTRLRGGGVLEVARIGRDLGTDPLTVVTGSVRDIGALARRPGRAGKTYKTIVQRRARSVAGLPRAIFNLVGEELP